MKTDFSNIWLMISILLMCSACHKVSSKSPAPEEPSGNVSSSSSPFEMDGNRLDSNLRSEGASDSLVNDTQSEAANENVDSDTPSEPPPSNNEAGPPDSRTPDEFFEQWTDAQKEPAIANRPEPSKCSLGEDGTGCANDDDCPSKSICYCWRELEVGNCVESGCTTDADCGGGSCAAIGAKTGDDCSTITLEYHCITEDDECVNNLDCFVPGKDIVTCVFERTLGHRICTDQICPI